MLKDIASYGLAYRKCSSDHDVGKTLKGVVTGMMHCNLSSQSHSKKLFLKPEPDSSFE